MTWWRRVLSRRRIEAQLEAGSSRIAGPRGRLAPLLVVGAEFDLSRAGYDRAAWTLSRYVASMLFGITPQDGVTLLGAVALLLATGLVAAVVPARRATAIEPHVALRNE